MNGAHDRAAVLPPRGAACLPLSPARPAFALLVAALALAVPLFAHGCHGDDVDHEPGLIFPLHRPDPEAPPCPASPP